MDLSALIFVALAVAWGVYLIPKALTQHEDSAARRSVEVFSDRMRVLARREAVDRRTAALVVTPGKPAPVIESVPAVPTPAQRRARRLAAAAATRRRRRVLGAIVFFIVDAVALAYVNVLPWSTVAAPAGLLLVWLVMCRVMVRREHRSDIAFSSSTVVELDESAPLEAADDGGPATEEFASISIDANPTPLSAPAEPTPDPQPAVPASGGWDPVPVTLPTYVGKEQAARRSVRTIDLESTGVWTSGRTAADSALAREADEARSQQTSPADDEKRRAAGS